MNDDQNFETTKNTFSTLISFLTYLFELGRWARIPAVAVIVVLASDGCAEALDVFEVDDPPDVALVDSVVEFVALGVEIALLEKKWF